MGKGIRAETSKLADLQIDMLQKLRSKQMSLNALEWWNNQSEENRQIIMRGDQPTIKYKTQEVKDKDINIDCDKDPFLPNDLKVEEHKKMGNLKLDLSKVEFFLSENQKGSRAVEGNKLRKELEDLPVLNANVLDYLLEHPHLIPGEWKKDERGLARYIFFWGTIYYRSSGDNGLFVRFLCWSGGVWKDSSYWLGQEFRNYNPAVLRV